MATVAVSIHPTKQDAPNQGVPSAAVAARQPSTRVVVSRTVFRFTWCVVFGLHVFCGSFGAALAALHGFIVAPEMFAYLVGVLHMLLAFLRGGAGVFALLAVGHCVVAFRMVYLSARQQQLSFVRLSYRREISHSQAPTRLLPASRTLIRWLIQVCIFPAKRLYRLWQHLFGVDGTVGVNGKHFESSFIARETVELLSQLYQTYQLSTAVASSWVNRFAVSTVVLNSVSTSVVRLTCIYFKTRSSTRRLATVVADLTLDFCGSIVVPVCILYRIVEEFDWKTKTVPPQLVYSDVWVADSVAEARQLLITSTLDLISSLTLHLGVLGALLTVAVDIRCEHDAKVDDIKGYRIRRRVQQARKSVVDFCVRARYTRRIHSATELCFAVCGVFVLVAHIHSQRDSSDVPACLLHVDSWFTSKFPCSVLRYSCTYSHDMDSLLGLLEPSVLTALIILHCAEPVLIPNRLNGFRNLRQLKFVNVSSLVWGDGVTLDEVHHPQLGYILFGYTNMTTVPSVLLHDRLPLSLREIEWSHSNLSTLPSNLDQFWTKKEWVAISFDHTLLKDIPNCFFNIRVQSLWLVDNRLNHIQPEAFESPSLQKIVLSGNPMQELPESLNEVPKSLREIYVEYTQLQSVPLWLDTWNRQKPSSIFSAYGSGFCASEGATSTPTHSSTLTKYCKVDFESIRGTIDWNFVWRSQKLSSPSAPSRT